MFQWASSAFDKLSQAVAPPPEDGPGRFVYLVQQGEEDAAMGCIAGMDPVHTIVNHAKGQYPIHLACQHSCMRLVQLLLNQPGMNIGLTDFAGNTPLHYASMSVAPNGLDVVKLIVASFGPSVVLAKNAQGQTPYDVATKNAIRQHLLPIQLQAETQIALDNGGQGLPPGIDLGGLRINNPAIAPPPTFGEGGLPSTPGPQPGPLSPAPPLVPAPHLFGTPSPSHNIASAPASHQGVIPVVAPDSGSLQGKSHEYSRVGSSSAAMSGLGKYRADGFHSSSSDVSLQRKYGHHANTSNNNSYGKTIAPPPSSGNSSVGMAVAASTNGLASPLPSSSGAANPFSVGSAGSLGGRYGALNGRSRYVTYGQVAAPSSHGSYPATAPVVLGNMSLFTPGGGFSATTTTTTPSSYGVAPVAAHTTIQPAPTSAGALTTPYLPPPPFQSHNYSIESAQNSANMADANAKDIFAAPSPQKEELGSSSPALAPEEPATATAVTGEIATSAACTSTTTTTATEGEITPNISTCETTHVNHWVEAVDPSSGQTYYYNSMTNETCWEKPTAAPASTSDIHTSANWLETVDPNTGHIYYYNSVTHETSWEKPLALVPGQSSAQPAMIEETTALAETSSSDPVPTPVPAEVAPESLVSGPFSPSDELSSPPLSATTATTTTSTPQAELAANDLSSATAFSPALVSTSDAISVPSPSASDAFGTPPPSDTAAVTPTDEATESASVPTPAQGCAADTFSSQHPSAVEAFGALPPSQMTTMTPGAGAGTIISPFLVAKHRRAVSADELFAEDPPTSGDEGKIGASPALVSPKKSEVNSIEIDGADEDMMDDVPLSPTLQRPVAESGAVVGNGTSQSDPPTYTPSAAAPYSDSDSLFAAIGMPPPPFSTRKR